jgi:hypothetical protein
MALNNKFNPVVFCSFCFFPSMLSRHGWFGEIFRAVRMKDGASTRSAPPVVNAIRGQTSTSLCTFVLCRFLAAQGDQA